MCRNARHPRAHHGARHHGPAGLQHQLAAQPSLAAQSARSFALSALSESARSSEYLTGCLGSSITRWVVRNTRGEGLGTDLYEAKTRPMNMKHWKAPLVLASCVLSGTSSLCACVCLFISFLYLFLAQRETQFREDANRTRRASPHTQWVRLFPRMEGAGKTGPSQRALGTMRPRATDA